MRTRSTIAVIGATGKRGTAICSRLAVTGHRLICCGNDLDSIHTLITGIRQDYPQADIDGVNCAIDASWEADIIILAVPALAEKEVAEKIKEVVSQKIVISIGNLLNTTNDAAFTPPTPPDSNTAEELQRILPHSRIIKAFSTSFTDSFITNLSFSRIPENMHN